MRGIDRAASLLIDHLLAQPVRGLLVDLVNAFSRSAMSRETARSGRSRVTAVDTEIYLISSSIRSVAIAAAFQAPAAALPSASTALRP
jgi:hypothetical protein